jgi:hypothetical protein
MRPWMNWMHCTGSTYGTWLRGDPRGWRARDHREHVEGDYRSPPPPGIYTEMFEQSKRSMKRPGVALDWEARVVAVRSMVEALRYHEVAVVDACIGARHWHVLARFIPLSEDEHIWASIEIQRLSLNREPRHLMGIAKKESARALSKLGLVEPGGVWARGCGRRYIKNEGHFNYVAETYVPGHRRQGAAVYSLLFPKD